MSDNFEPKRKVLLKLGSSEEVKEFVAQTGGIFYGKIINLVFSRFAFLKYLKSKNELEYVIKKGVANYIYKIPDKYIREYHNIRWKKTKTLNSKGELELRKRVVKKKREMGLKGKYTKYINEPFFKETEKEMFVNENKNIYWNYSLDGLNESYFIYCFAMQLMYIFDYIIPYTKSLLKNEFPKRFQKYAGKGVYFTKLEDDRGIEKNCCIILECMKSHETIIKILDKLGASERIENRCHFFIVSANLSTQKKLITRIKKFNKHITDDSGKIIRVEKNRFRDLKIMHRYFKELDDYINRGS